MARRGRPVGGTSPPKTLADMRWVYDHLEDEPDTPSRRKYRTMADENFSKFDDLLHKREKEWAEVKLAARETGGGPEQKDDGIERLEELAAQLLGEVLP